LGKDVNARTSRPGTVEVVVSVREGAGDHAKELVEQGVHERRVGLVVGGVEQDGH